MSYAFGRAAHRKRSLGDGEGSLAFEEVTMDDVNSTLERLREFPEFAEMEARAARNHGELEYVLGDESSFHNGRVTINRHLRGTAYTTRGFPPGVEGYDAEIAWELSADVSSAAGIQVPFSLERVLFHEVNHGIHRSGFHSESTVIRATNEFMWNHFSEPPRYDHRIHIRDLR